MNTTDTLTHQRVTLAVTVLSHPGLIRLVSEIDDNGPFPRRMLARTLADLTRHQIRHAMDTAREQHLIRAGQHASDPSYLLSEAGEELADVYDTAARWARAHHYPARDSDFVTRVQQTLALLAQQPVLDALTSQAHQAVATDAAQRVVDTGLLTATEAVLGLRGPWAALSGWIRANPSVLTPDAQSAA